MTLINYIQIKEEIIMKSIMKIALSVLFAFTLMSGIDIATKQQVSTPVIVNVSAKKKKKLKKKKKKSKRVYYARTSKKYHSTTSCRSLRRSKVLYYTSLADAKKSRLKPCKICYR
jgi:hypothetical protein